MSKPIKRRCPQCGKVKLFRADQKTCGCLPPSAAPKVDPLVGRYFHAANDAHGEWVIGRFVSRISPSLYLVAYNDLFDGKESWRENLVPLSVMGGWKVLNESGFAVLRTLREMEAKE